MKMLVTSSSQIGCKKKYKKKQQLKIIKKYLEKYNLQAYPPIKACDC